MRKGKEVAILGLYVALLIGGQVALSTISGVEVVTILLLTFAYVFGIRRGLIVATAFSLLRCFIFGFFPNVIILYLIYYNLFVITIGGLRQVFKGAVTPLKHVMIIALALILTAIFTALDNVLTPLFYGLGREEWKAYATLSLTSLIPQLFCTLITVSLLFRPLYKVLVRVKSTALNK